MTLTRVTLEPSRLCDHPASGVTGLCRGQVTGDEGAQETSDPLDTMPGVFGLSLNGYVEDEGTLCGALEKSLEIRVA